MSKRVIVDHYVCSSCGTTTGDLILRVYARLGVNYGMNDSGWILLTDTTYCFSCSDTQLPKEVVEDLRRIHHPIDRSRVLPKELLSRPNVPPVPEKN